MAASATKMKTAKNAKALGRAGAAAEPGAAAAVSKTVDNSNVLKRKRAPAPAPAAEAVAVANEPIPKTPKTSSKTVKPSQPSSTPKMPKSAKVQAKQKNNSPATAVSDAPDGDADPQVTKEETKAEALSTRMTSAQTIGFLEVLAKDPNQTYKGHGVTMFEGYAKTLKDKGGDFTFTPLVLYKKWQTLRRDHKSDLDAIRKQKDHEPGWYYDAMKDLLVDSPSTEPPVEVSSLTGVERKGTAGVEESIGEARTGDEDEDPQTPAPTRSGSAKHNPRNTTEAKQQQQGQLLSLLTANHKDNVAVGREGVQAIKEGNDALNRSMGQALQVMQEQSALLNAVMLSLLKK